MYAVRKSSLCFNPNSKSPYRLSRTRIDNFYKCQRCFWLEERFGIKKPDSYPFTLNIAVDALLKKEFDIHRARGKAHPLMEQYGVDAVPLDHDKLNTWRNNFEGVSHIHTPTNLHVFGAVDDVWINPKGEFIVVDYKATAKATAPTLDGDLGMQYKRQMEVYQWILRQMGFTVSPVGYFVYVNGKKDAEAFDGKLEFDVLLLPCEGDTGWVEPTLVEIKKTLLSETIPPIGASCDYCPYREAAGKKLAAISVANRTAVKNKKEAIAKIPKRYEKTTASLF